MTTAPAIVRFVLLDETGPRDVLLFGCKGCPDRTFTSHMLEYHMNDAHQAKKFTVDTVKAVRSRPKSSAT